LAPSNASKAGFAIFVGAVQLAIVVVVSEVIDPIASSPHIFSTGNETGYTYSVSSNYISDLGANCLPSGACYIPPSALLFDSSVVVLGLTLLICAYYLNRAFRWMPATLLVAIAGLGAIGVGVFPETTGIVHEIPSLVAFLFAGLSAIASYKLQKKPLGYLSVVLGALTIASLILALPTTWQFRLLPGSQNYLGLGPGGIERLVFYPTILWAISFGSHMMATEDKPQGAPKSGPQTGRK
jgi:hypothetical membrane protein